MPLVWTRWSWRLSYDTSRLEVTSAADVQRGSLTAGFDSFVVNLDQATGVILISGYCSGGASPSPLPLSQGERGDGQPLSQGERGDGLPLSQGERGDGGAGSLAVIRFQVKADAPAGSASINLLENSGNTWTLPGGTNAQGNDFLFDLEPRPSNAAGSVLDGRIDVLAPAVASVPGNDSPTLVQTVAVGDASLVRSQKDEGGSCGAEPRKGPGDVPQDMVVNNLLGALAAQAADAQPVVQSGVVMEQLPALAAAGGPNSVATVQTLMPEMFRRFLEVETKGIDDQRDDFFSGYLAGVADGVVGSLEQLQVGEVPVFEG